MPLVLYKIDGSPPVRGTLMTIEILSLNVESTEVNIVQDEQFKPEYLIKNPLHTVPLLEDGDFILADSHAIMTYLVSKYGGGKKEQFYPSDYTTRALIDQRLYMDASILFPSLSVVVRGMAYRNSTGPTEQQIADIEEAYGFLEQYLQRSPYLVGNNVTLADVSCVATVSSLNAGIHPIGDNYPRVKEWLQRLEGESWYQKANAPGLAKFIYFVQHLKTKNTS